MRALVGCLNDWLASHREDAGAYSLLIALTQETLKRVDSPSAAQREFDAQDLAAAAGRPEANDFNASKRWVMGRGLETYAAARSTRFRKSSLRMSSRAASSPAAANKSITSPASTAPPITWRTATSMSVEPPLRLSAAPPSSASRFRIIDETRQRLVQVHGVRARYIKPREPHVNYDRQPEVVGRIFEPVRQ